MDLINLSEGKWFQELKESCFSIVGTILDIFLMKEFLFVKLGLLFYLSFLQKVDINLAGILFLDNLIILPKNLIAFYSKNLLSIINFFTYQDVCYPIIHSFTLLNLKSVLNIAYLIIIIY